MTNKIEIEITDKNKDYLQRLVRLGVVEDIDQAINKTIYTLRKSGLKAKIENKEDAVNLI